ncbi:MAG: hypothetical protein E7B46_08155 [Clostridium perfringens]|nr:hypothetical protein [Clostridium perfringens]
MFFSICTNLYFYEKVGILAGVIVSGTKAESIGVDISDKENELQIKNYR